MTVLAQRTALTVNKFTSTAYCKLTKEENVVSDNEKCPRKFWNSCAHMFTFVEEVETFETH
jgi:hypothetical protein